MSNHEQSSFDVDTVRSQFPILQRKVNGHNLCYLDNAATTHKPQSVIDAMSNYYLNSNSNVHRGTHFLSQESTGLYEGVRENVREYINAKSVQEIIYTSGVTDSINLVANSLAYEWSAGDEIIISGLEHHSNIVPWQFLRDRIGIVIRVLPIDEHGDIRLEELPSMLNTKTKLVAISHISNALGTLNPITEIITLAHQNNSLVLVDGAQSTGHMKLDMQKMDCDFFTFSAHKIFGPTGIGVLYGKEHLLATMHPYKGGGDMIISVSFESTEYNELPYRFEAGTPNICGVIGLGAAIDFLRSIDLDRVGIYEHKLLQTIKDGLKKMSKITMIGTTKKQVAVQSFQVDGIHALDLATMLDQDGVALRVGHHCAMPALYELGHSSSLRVSIALYNTEEEIARFLYTLKNNINLLAT